MRAVVFIILGCLDVSLQGMRPTQYGICLEHIDRIYKEYWEDRYFDAGVNRFYQNASSKQEVVKHILCGACQSCTLICIKKGLVNLPCGHLMCLSCLKKWLSDYRWRAMPCSCKEGDEVQGEESLFTQFHSVTRCFCIKALGQIIDRMYQILQMNDRVYQANEVIEKMCEYIDEAMLIDVAMTNDTELLDFILCLLQNKRHAFVSSMQKALAQAIVVKASHAAERIIESLGIGSDLLASVNVAIMSGNIAFIERFVTSEWLERLKDRGLSLVKKVVDKNNAIALRLLVDRGADMNVPGERQSIITQHNELDEPVRSRDSISYREMIQRLLSSESD